MIVALDRLHREVQRGTKIALLRSVNHRTRPLLFVNTMSVSRNVTRRASDEATIQEETFPAAEKILSDIENIIKKDHELRSFEIIPIQDNENKSPVYHEEHSLGLASWCVQPLYRYAHGRLIDVRSRIEHRREESSTISKWLMGALLLNPDVATFWNMRRELVRSGRSDGLAELRFTAIVLHHKAKCFEAFAYRRWLLRHLLVGGKSSSGEMENLLRDEIRVAGISADRYANNYHAWSHREHVLVTSCRESSLSDSYHRFLKSEWEDSGRWCSRHVSDHSGLAYRQFLLDRLLYENDEGEKKDGPAISPSQLASRRHFLESLLADSGDESPLAGAAAKTSEPWQLLNILHNSRFPKRPEVDYDRLLVALSYWAEDCKSNENSVLSFPGHEALWYHRRYLGHALASLQYSYRRHGRYQRDSGSSPRRIETSAEQPGLLVRVFNRDNERIVALSRASEHHAQTTLGEKFFKYLREFGLDGASSNDARRQEMVSL